MMLLTTALPALLAGFLAAPALAAPHAVAVAQESAPEPSTEGEPERAPAASAAPAAYLVSSGPDDRLQLVGPRGEVLPDLVPPGAGGLAGPQTTWLAPDGLLWVASWRSGALMVYDPDTGASVGEALRDPALQGPYALHPGDDGELLVSCHVGARVLRVDPARRVVLGDLLERGRLNSAHDLLRVGEHWLVTDMAGSAIRRFRVSDGAYVDDLASGAPLAGPQCLLREPGAETLLVSNWRAGRVLRLDPRSGALETFVEDPALLQSDGLGLGAAGELLVCSYSAGQVRRYALSDGAFLGVLAVARGPNAVRALPRLPARLAGEPTTAPDAAAPREGER